ncbi:MAG: hypothetical protein M9904_08835 [Chitinophagaceae bacterium]|nr:hypothetical protein [Chitinophagaceae bacterium]
MLLPLLIYSRYYPVASTIQAIYSVVVVALSIYLCLRWTKKYEGGISNRKQIADINLAQIEVVKVKTNRAIKREDPEDFGIAYYLDVTDDGQQKTLYLWGQYLDELEYEKQFPNTEFEFIRNVGSEEFIDFKTTGEYFEAERTLPAFDKEVWKSGNYPLNGQLLNQTIDSVS